MAAAWRHRQPHSAWPDFNFVLNQVAIEPQLPIARAITEWNEISVGLAYPLRLRLDHLESYFDYSQTS